MHLKEYSLNSNETCMRCNASKTFTLVIIHDDYDITQRRNGVRNFNCPPSSTTNTISNSEYIDNCDTQIIVNKTIYDRKSG